MRLDLHIHTTASDGSWSPGAVVRGAAKGGLECGDDRLRPLVEVHQAQFTDAADRHRGTGAVRDDVDASVGLLGQERQEQAEVAHRVRGGGLVRLVLEHTAARRPLV